MATPSVHVPLEDKLSNLKTIGGRICHVTGMSRFVLQMIILISSQQKNQKGGKTTLTFSKVLPDKQYSRLQIEICLNAPTLSVPRVGSINVSSLLSVVTKSTGKTNVTTHQIYKLLFSFLLTCICTAATIRL